MKKLLNIPIDIRILIAKLLAGSLVVGVSAAAGVPQPVLNGMLYGFIAAFTFFTVQVIVRRVRKQRLYGKYDEREDLIWYRSSYRTLLVVILLLYVHIVAAFTVPQVMKFPPVFSSVILLGLIGISIVVFQLIERRRT